MAAICGTSPGAPLDPGVEVVFSDSVAVRGPEETVDLGVVSVSDEQALVPQAEEQIADARWVKKSQLPELLNNTFPSVKEVLGESFK